MSGEDRFGKALVKAGVVSQEQLAEAMFIQQQENIFIGQIFVEKGWCSEREIVRGLSSILRLRSVKIEKALISRKVVQLVPRSLAINHTILPLLVQNTTLFLAMQNPLDREAIEKIKAYTGMNVTPLVALSGQLRDAVRRHYNISEYVGNMLENVEEKEELTVEKPPPVQQKSERQTPSSDETDKRSQVVRLWNMVVSEGMKARASDIHIEPTPQNVRIRYRIDGMLTRGIKLPREVYTPLISRIKMLAGMDIADRSNPQDGHIRATYAQRKINLRVSTVPTSSGEQVVLRLLDQNALFYNITRLGLSSEQLRLYQTFIEESQGLILATGPTGNGKTTTLYALLNEMKDGTKHFVTIEDPIEYQLEGITQIQVNSKSGITFVSGLRSVLRQDPNVILLGEIRDAETASVALQASETGHLVLSTLHTVDAVSAINRLLSLDIGPELIASNLLVVIAQRLMRRICPRCIQEYTPTPHELESIGMRREQAELDLIFYRGNGCKACKHTGYYGRTGVFEMFIPDERLRREIIKGTARHELKRLAVEAGMQTILENGIEKVLQGLITVEELLRVCPVDQIVSKNASLPPEHTTSDVQLEEQSTLPQEEQQETATSETCTQCGAALQQEWVMCPFCGTMKADVIQVPSQTPLQNESLPKQVDVPKWKERIVVAEDDPDARMMIKFFLQRQGYQVILAVDGEEALEKIRAERPDIVILDINMPKKDGYEVCKVMRTHVATLFTPVIMLTAQASIEAKLQGLSVGADDYLTKPYHPAELAARIETILRRSYQHEVIAK